MKTTIITNSLKELKTVAQFYGIQVESSEIVVSFPYRFENENVAWQLDEEITFGEFIERNGILIF